MKKENSKHDKINLHLLFQTLIYINNGGTGMMCNQRNYKNKLWYIPVSVALVTALVMVSVRMWYLAAKPNWYDKDMYFTHDFYTMRMTQNGEVTLSDYLQAYNTDAVVWSGDYFLYRKRLVLEDKSGVEMVFTSDGDNWIFDAQKSSGRTSFPIWAENHSVWAQGSLVADVYEKETSFWFNDCELKLDEDGRARIIDILGRFVPDSALWSGWYYLYDSKLVLKDWSADVVLVFGAEEENWVLDEKWSRGISRLPQLDLMMAQRTEDKVIWEPTNRR